MSIYRGAGGSGDAVADSSSEALLIRELVAEAQVDADSASASATAAAGSASNASTAATSASGSASTATTQASNASTSATNAASSATSASNSASTATTQAGIATTQATNSASSASAASTSATNAATSASTATTQAGIATTQATNAATSASTASAAASAALSSLDSFDDRYLGSKSSAPTLDNDGNALTAGALYFDTVSNSMKVYTGSVWVDAYADGATFLTKANPSYTGTLTGGTGVVNLGSGQFYKDASGNVGIGTASPVYKLNVVASDSSNTVGGSTAAINITNSNATGFGKTADLDFSVGGGTIAEKIAGLSAVYTNYTSSVGGALAFCTNNGSGSYAERMRIDSSGNVVIGTATANKKVTVYSPQSGLRLNHDFTGNVSYSELSFSSSGVVGNGASIRSYRASESFNGNEGDLRFYTNTGGGGASSDGSEAMRIDSSGSVLVDRTSSQFLGGVAKFGITQADSGAWAMGVNANGNAIVFNHTANASAAVGSITVTTSLTLYNTTSDYRLKTVIAPVADAGTRIDALQPIEYDWNIGGRTRGFLAHQFAEVYPDSVTGEKDAIDADGKPIYQGMQASSPEVMADLIAEIQSLRKRVAQLESK